ncbi:MAG: L-aspartate oxidase [Eggerthellaceae bacterium]|nr:L-aspartate oxidase [Eggerthellaceae bacterium]
MVADVDICCDVLIAGCGVAGLFCALNLPPSLDVILLSKGSLDECDSMLAQGGICVLRDECDYADFFRDTMRAGRYKNRIESVDAMIRESRGVIEDLISLGVGFNREPDGSLSYTREAAHSRARICHCEDQTGKEITERLLEAVRRLPNAKIIEHAALTDIIVQDGACVGASVENRACADESTSRIDFAPENLGVSGLSIAARFTVLATGGIGGLYLRSTNYPILTGDSLRIARKHGIDLEDVDCVQFHPTALHTGKPGRAFLISESARGEGAVLIDASGKRFTDELAPRDVATAAIEAKMREEGSDHVWLSFANLDASWVKARFPGIYKRCLEEGWDITREPIPVSPAQHYHMGGVRVDLDSRTSMDGLFAVGECSCNGVHGRNRLASNSLLESLVFARRAACAIGSLLGAEDRLDG